MKIQYYFVLVRLLKMGFSYTEIFTLSEEDVNFFLGIDEYIEEKKADAYEQNSR